MLAIRFRSRSWVGASLAAVLAATGAFLSAAPAAAATSWYVNSTTGLDTNDCLSSTTACMTIQAAIGKASAGDTINVASGVYLESPSAGLLTVNKALTLFGAQHGVDARGRAGSESILSLPRGTDITSSGVTVDGFTVENSTAPAFTGFGLLMGAGTTGTQVVNNIIRDNIVGIGLANTGVSQALIRHNAIQNNNGAGAASGDGIYTDEFVGGGAVTNVLITENAFTGNADAGIDISNTDAAHGVSNLDISSNVFDQNGRATIFFNTHNSTIHNNVISNNTLAGSAAIRIFDNNSGLSITHNDLVNGVGHGIRFSNLGLVGGPSSNVVINFNNIGTTATSFPLSGLTVDTTTPAAYVGTVDATCNWWGSPSGPTNASNPGGTGEAVVGPATFKPWWTMRSQTSPCPAPPECKPGEEDHGDGDVKDENGKSRGHFHFDECDSNQDFSHEDPNNNVDFHSSPSDHSAPQFDANLPTATTTGHGLNNGQDVTYVLVVTAGQAPLTGFYSLILSDVSGVIYVSSGTLSAGSINVVG